MTIVTSTIKQLIAKKDAMVISGMDQVRGLLADVRTQIVSELSAMRGDTYTAAMLKEHLASVSRYLSAFESAGSADMAKLLDRSWEAGAGMVPDVMRSGGLFYAFGHIPGPVLSMMRDYSAHKISGLSSDAFTKIRGELSLGVLGQKTPQQVISGIAGSLSSKGTFASLEQRAETIAKTEMGRAYSAATNDGLQQAARSVPEMQKEWWHAGHPKVPRASHLAINGQHQKVSVPFLLGNLQMDYPRDPKAPIQEVINCGCEVIPWHPSWGRPKGAK